MFIYTGNITYSLSVETSIQKELVPSFHQQSAILADSAPNARLIAGPGIDDRDKQVTCVSQRWLRRERKSAQYFLIEAGWEVTE